ncbi:MAG: hypothetical protein KBC73_25035 [Burkholderiaceae bacterium]|nr:hypothetical protein [Burkholderiaceae bacterium]
MNAPEHPPAPPAPPPDDDLAWAEALAGRAPAGADAGTVAEARQLRQALQRWPAAVPEPRLDLRRLLDAAHRQGLLRRDAAAPCAWCQRLRSLLQQPAPWAGLALAGLLGWLVLPQPPLPPEPAPTLRNAGAVQRILSQQPQADRDALAAALGPLGAQVQTYQRHGRAGLDAQFGLPLAPATRDWLAARGLQAAADGSLRVEFADSGTP